MFRKILFGFFIFLIVVTVALVGVAYKIRTGLPSISKLDEYKPLLVTQVYDRNGEKIGEFFRQRRVLIPYEKIPKMVVNAFLAAEDDKFFEHRGVNLTAIARASIANLKAGHSVQGGSTITQQVAKTLLLNDERTMLRKVSEAILAIEMEQHLSKEEILYLYLNQIYFGQGAYGIEVAAETYFRKPVDKLTIPEAAMLAGLPKAPSSMSPVNNPKRAKERQIYVINRMEEVGFISRKEANEAIQQPLKVYLREDFFNRAPHFLESIRVLLVEKLGEKALLEDGLTIKTSIDLKLQLAAQQAVTDRLHELDKRGGYRGPSESLKEPKQIGEFLVNTKNKLLQESMTFKLILPDGKVDGVTDFDINYSLKKQGLPRYLKTGESYPAVVEKIDNRFGIVYVRIAEVHAAIDFETMRWARKPDPEKKLEFDPITSPGQALKVGDVILAKFIDTQFKALPVEEKLRKAKVTMDFSEYVKAELDQVPQSEAALLSIDNQTQDILALVGGYDFQKSQYNRALQAARQTGSLFKAIIYASALDKGMTASTPLMDAPIVYEETDQDAEGQEESKIWKPANHSKKFSGDIILRNALVKSLNVPSVKIMEQVGLEWGANYARRLNIVSPLSKDFTLVLGSSSVTLYEMTKVFSVFARGGLEIEPIGIRSITDHENQKILENFSFDARFKNELTKNKEYWSELREKFLEAQENNKNTPNPAPTNTKTLGETESPMKAFFFENEKQLISSQTAYLMTSLLKGVVEDPNGTGGRARALGREVAGKTGSTNGYYDAWFIGYTPQITTGVWVGHDQEKSLGKGEVGGRAALPIWLDYMEAAHTDLPILSFPAPEGIIFVNIDAQTGRLASGGSSRVLRQAFREGTEPTSSRDEEEEKSDFLKGDANDQ